MDDNYSAISASLFMPHGQCFLWQSPLLWLHVGSDFLITTAYYTISASLFYFLHKRRDIPFKWMFVLFGLFIFACGTTHLMEIWTVWRPDYWEEGVVKALTAGLSFSTGLLLIPLIPKAMALRSPTELEHLNAHLQTALGERQVALATLESSQTQLLWRQQQLQRMASQVTLAEQRERHRLATDLHDYLAQLLVVCRLKVGQALNNAGHASSDVLAELQDVLDRCLRYTRTLVGQLCPTALYESGVVVALRQLAEQMGSNGLEVTVESDDPDLSVTEDEAIFIYQTVRELLFNVLKHAGTNQAQVVVQRTGRCEIDVSVRDRGIGFDTRSLENRSVSNRFGLFSIRERLEALGGRLGIQSAPGLGTTVICTVPLKEAESSPAALNEAAGSSTVALPGSAATRQSVRIRVLVVDDHAMVRQGIVSLLSHYHDVEVIGEAPDGEAAVELAVRLHPDVILMDINMPRLNGIDATRQIVGRFPAIKVIGLSVNEDMGMVESLRAAGAHGFVPKNSAAEGLCQAIRDCVRNHSITQGTDR